MDTTELAALIPGLMTRHQEHVWTVLSGERPADDLLMVMSPVNRPERVATVRVFAGAEVFMLEVAGHDSTDFAYTDQDRLKVLEGRIDLGAAATLGPTRVVLDRCGDLIVGSSMVIDPDGPCPRQDGGASRPFRRLSAHLRGRKITRDVIDYRGVRGV